MTSSEPNRAAKATDSSIHTRTSEPPAFSAMVLPGAAAENHLRSVRFRYAVTALCPGPRSGPGSGSLSYIAEDSAAALCSRAPLDSH